MATTLRLAASLAGSRFHLTKAFAWLELLGILSFALCSWMIFTVASGTYMFFSRSSTPREETFQLLSQIGMHRQFAYSLTPVYVFLAVTACALLITPVLTLGSSAARLGAQAKAETLATMRLVGLTSGQAVMIRVAETLISAVAGLLVGVGAWALSLPFWKLFSFQGAHIEVRELLLPWWVWTAGVSIMLVLSVISTVMGLRQVWISPLGVSRRGQNPALRWWRLGFFLIVLAGFFTYLRLGKEADLSFLVAIALAAGFVALTTFAMMVLLPWVLQNIMKPLTRTSSPALLLAARRIISNPKRAWRGVGALSLLLVLTTFVSGSVSAVLGGDRDTGASFSVQKIFMLDLQTGLALTLIFAVFTGAMVTLTQQASGIIENAPIARALDHGGVPRSLHLRIRLLEVLLPLVTGIIGAVGVGSILSLILSTGTGMKRTSDFVSVDSNSWILVAGTVVLAIVFALGSVLAPWPLERALLGLQRRRND